VERHPPHVPVRSSLDLDAASQLPVRWGVWDGGRGHATSGSEIWAQGPRARWRHHQLRQGCRRTSKSCSPNASIRARVLYKADWSGRVPSRRVSPPPICAVNCGNASRRVSLSAPARRISYCVPALGNVARDRLSERMWSGMGSMIMLTGVSGHHPVGVNLSSTDCSQSATLSGIEAHIPIP
jgi:hypothetical protein